MPDGPAGAADAAPIERGVASVVVSGYPGSGMPPQYFAAVPVVFYKADGSVGSVVATDAMGRASATIETGSFVAVVNHAEVSAAIANPGDTLHFGPTIPSAPNGSVHVTWPALVFQGYTTYYYVYTSCGDSGETTATSATIALDAACSANGFDVVVTGRRSSGEVKNMISRTGVAANGAVVTVNLADNGGAWQAGGTHAIDLANTPAGASSLDCLISQQLGGHEFYGTGIVGTSSLACGGMRLMPEPQSTVVVDTAFERDDDHHFTVQARQTMPVGALVPVDASNHLPWITSLAYAPATRTVTWTSEADAPFDASALRITVEQGRFLVWRIVAPAGLPKTFTIPALPAELAASDLAATDVAELSLANIDFAGVSPADFMATRLDDEYGFPDKARRGATARNP